jgi:hypothetical protein
MRPAVSASMPKTDERANKQQRRKPRSYLAAAVTVVFVSLVATTVCGAFESSFTSIAERQCRKTGVLNIDDTEYAASRACPGRGGYKVFIDEEDLRETLTVGRTMHQAGQEPAARDFFGAFNSYDDKIEWRSGKDGRPFALIAGWSFADSENVSASGRPNSVRLLVVMRLPPGPVCKVAYIDRAANSNADELARQAADDIAPSFKCGSDSVQTIGQQGPGIAAMTRLTKKSGS